MKKSLILLSCLMLTGCFEETYCFGQQDKNAKLHKWSEWTDVGWKREDGAQQVERQCEVCKRKQLRQL